MSFLMKFFTQMSGNQDFDVIPEGVNINYTSFNYKPT